MSPHLNDAVIFFPTIHVDYAAFRPALKYTVWGQSVNYLRPAVTSM